MSAVRAQIVRWGNSNAIRIPKTILDQARMREGEEVEIQLKAGHIAIKPAKEKITLKSLVAGIKPENQHGEQDWGTPVGREVW